MLGRCPVDSRQRVRSVSLDNLVELTVSVAGFENFGSRRDISAVFEIEREVGSFYRGWDEEDDPVIQLPPAFDPEEDKDRGQLPTGQAVETNPDSFLFPQSAPHPSSPSRIESNIDTPRSRHNSMPSARPSPQAPAFQPGPMLARPRRNSSILEPSPLARLFVRSPDDSGLVDRMRERRQSLVSALAGSQSQPALSSILSPPKTRVKRLSQEISQPRSDPPSEPRKRLHAVRPSIARIDEGKALSFSGRSDSPARGRNASPAKGGVPFPRHGESEISDTIGKASEIQEIAGVDQSEGEKINDRLAKIDSRQRRIERLLEKLVAGKDGDGDVFDDT